MLTIQPKVLNSYRPAFKAQEIEDDEEIIDLSRMDQDTYESMRDELEDQRDEFEELADSDEFKLPKPVNKVIKGGAVVTTGLLGGMAAGWGTKKSLTGLSKLNKTKAVRSFAKEVKSFKTSVKETATTIKLKFLNSDFYKKPTNAIKNAYNNFGKKKFGKPIVEFLNSLGSGIKRVYNKIKTGIKHVWDNIRGIKKETWEKATVNTVGVSGGVASGVTALKDKSGENN